MQEVQALCDRAIVINKGTIVADATIKDLVSGNEGVTIFIAEFETPVAIDDLMSIEGVSEVREQSPSSSSFKIISNRGTDLRPAIFRFAADKNLSLLGLRQEENSLESVFRDLTKSPSA